MLSALFLTLLAPDVLTVDDSGGADFDDLQRAIQAAHDGDLLLIRDGSYGAFTIDGKSLALVADGGAVVTQPGVVQGLAPDQQVAIRGLRIVQPATALFSVPLLRLDACAGLVLIEDAWLDGAGSDAVLTTSALRADGCQAVYVVGSTLRAAAGSPFLVGPGPFGAAHGVDATDSTVSLHDSEVTGGAGAAGWFTAFDTGIPPLAGAHGAWLDGGSLDASGTTFAGGVGGDGADWPGGACWNGAKGGAGVAVGEGVISLLDVTLSGGVGGGASGLPCSDGASGDASLLVGSGDIGSLPAKAAAAFVPPPAREGELLSLNVDAPVDSVVVMYVAPSIGIAPPPAGTGILGVLALAGPASIVGVDTVSAGGPASFSATVPELGFRVPALTWYAQALVIPPTDAPVLTGPVSLVLLDAAF